MKQVRATRTGLATLPHGDSLASDDAHLTGELMLGQTDQLARGAQRDGVDGGSGLHGGAQSTDAQGPALVSTQLRPSASGGQCATQPKGEEHGA